MIPDLNLGVNVALTTITASDSTRSLRSGCMARQPARRPDWRTRFVTEIPAAVALFDQELRYLAASAASVEAFDLSRIALVGRRHNELRKGGGEIGRAHV